MEVVLYALFVVAWALLWANLDRNAIDKGKRILHALRWCLRAGLVIAVAAGFAHRLGKWWSILPLLTMGAFGFSAVFRLRLNSLRGLHPCYVSPSNWYDWQFIVAAWWIHWHRTPYRWCRKGVIDEWRLYHLDYDQVPRNELDHQMDLTQHAHQSGRLAYITEITLTILSAFVVGWINWNAQ